LVLVTRNVADVVALYDDEVNKVPMFGAVMHPGGFVNLCLFKECV
jgi:hypothetical protein